MPSITFCSAYVSKPKKTNPNSMMRTNSTINALVGGTITHRLYLLELEDDVLPPNTEEWSEDTEATDVHATSCDGFRRFIHPRQFLSGMVNLVGRTGMACMFYACIVAKVKQKLSKGEDRKQTLKKIFFWGGVRLGSINFTTIPILCERLLQMNTIL